MVTIKHWHYWVHSKWIKKEQRFRMQCNAIPSLFWFLRFFSIQNIFCLIAFDWKSNEKNVNNYDWKFFEAFSYFLIINFNLFDYYTVNCIIHPYGECVSTINSFEKFDPWNSIIDNLYDSLYESQIAKWRQITWKFSSVR